MLKDLLGDTLEGMLEAEMDEYWAIPSMSIKTKILMTAETATAKRQWLLLWNRSVKIFHETEKGNSNLRSSKRINLIFLISKIRFYLCKSKG